MNKLLLFLLLMAGPAAFAQKYTIQGRVAEKHGGALPSASIVLLQEKDSSLVSHATTDTEGLFVLPAARREAYILKATFLGFAPYFQKVTLPSESFTVHLGTIELQPVVRELAVVTVTGTKPPVVLKEDTVEYNAGSFGTRQHGNVAQLLKKLPGVEVEQDGNIRVQGESITRIFVDGKEFFGGDVPMAIRSLPAHVIDKVQVIDGKPEESRFSGIDNGRREKIINLTLKEDRPSTGFGKAMAGVGTADRYAAEANYNRFDKGDQLSVTGTSNNLNNQGLSSDRMGEGGSSMEFTQNGLVNAYTAGVNTLKQVSRKTSLNGSYGYNYTDATIHRDLTRQNFLPEGTAMYVENSRGQSRNSGHQANVGLEHKDPRNMVRLNAAFGLTGDRTENSTSRQSYSVSDTLVNEGERSSVTHNSHFSLNTSLFYGHRFQKEGRVFTVVNHFASKQAEAVGRSESFIWFREGAEENEKQQNEQVTGTSNYGIRLSYTEPLGKKQYLQAHYNASNRHAASDLEVYARIFEIDRFDEEQSRRFSTGFLNHQAGLSYQLNRDRYNLTIGSFVQQSDLSGVVQKPGGEVKRFRNVLPNLTLNRQISRYTRFNLVYHTSVREPSPEQLQPAPSRFDPLHLQMGNPALRPEYTHQGRLTFNTSSARSGLFLSGSVTFDYTTHPITTAVTLDDRQVRTTQYVNMGETTNFSAYLNLGVPVTKYNSRVIVRPYLRQGQGPAVLNGVTGVSNQQSAGGDLAYTYTVEELVDINLRTNISITDAEYAWNKSQNQLLVRSVYMVDATVHFLQHFNLTAEMSYNKFRNARSDFNQAIPVYNFSLSRMVAKDGQGELKIAACNVLNRQLGASQFATPNYIEQSTQHTQGSFYMVSLTLNLTKPERN